MGNLDVLLTFTGFQDPYAIGLIGEEEQSGPILSLVGARSFDRIILFSTPSTEKNTSATRAALQSLYPKIGIEVRDLPLHDPTDYVAILTGLRTHLREITDSTSRANYFIAVASGTPQMHASWVLLAASGEIPAHILNVRRPRFVSKDRPLVFEVDLSATEFPRVRSNICSVETPNVTLPDLDTVLRELRIVGDHPTVREALEIGATLASSLAPILILGETGTGKELFARFVHRLSGRRLDRFIPINCAAIPEDLVESILFGHKKGSFTGATSDQMGKFDLADGGTLFLDELPELPMPSQAKLLRVLQDGLVEPVGEKKAHKVSVRVIRCNESEFAQGHPTREVSGRPLLPTQRGRNPATGPTRTEK
jgi:sigma54-dependent transcription regulator